MSMKNKKSRNGFSLIELLVVIAIMTVLTTIVYVSVNATRSKSRDQQRISTILKIKLALEYYYNFYGSYPVTLATIYSGTSPLPSTSPGKITASDVAPPNNDQAHGYFYVPLKRSSTDGICNLYHLYTKLESKTSALELRAGCDSSSVPVCTGGNQALRVNVSSSTDIIYDARP